MDDVLKDFDPFDIFDAEAARLDAFFAGLSAQEWERPSRCGGWSVRDVLGHLAGEELYNQACLDGNVQEVLAIAAKEGITGYNEFNEWCVRQRRDLPVGEVLEEWRTKNADTRARMRQRGRDGTVDTMVGPYSAGLQTFHYDSEFATHADDIGAPVADEEADGRTLWRVAVGRFALAERGSDAQVEQTAEQIWVSADGAEATLSYPEFVAATVGRPDPGLDSRLATALRCLA